jgi:hypothetical protein
MPGGHISPSERSGGRGRRFFTVSAVHKLSGCGKHTKKDVIFKVRNNARLVSAVGRDDTYPVGI